jgi:hypothetical protein
VDIGSKRRLLFEPFQPIVPTAISSFMVGSSAVNFTVETLVGVVRQKRQRLAHGLQLRDAIHAALDDGRELDHYRVAWIKDSVVRLFGELEEIARDFNRDHPDDCCSVHDFCDVLASAIGTLKMRIDGDDN